VSVRSLPSGANFFKEKELFLELSFLKVLNIISISSIHNYIVKGQI